VVLFHDSPPQGQGSAEVLEAGLGLVRGLLPLPHASHRLKLREPSRVALFALRFRPLLCIPLDGDSPDGALVLWDGRGWRGIGGTQKLTKEGALMEVGG
jgi:hypothetical protein